MLFNPSDWIKHHSSKAHHLYVRKPLVIGEGDSAVFWVFNAEVLFDFYFYIVSVYLCSLNISNFLRDQKSIIDLPMWFQSLCDLEFVKMMKPT